MSLAKRIVIGLILITILFSIIILLVDPGTFQSALIGVAVFIVIMIVNSFRKSP